MNRLGRYGFIMAFLALLVVPLVVHAWKAPSHAGANGGELRLVIITPHGQEIRNEFRWAFADWHKAHYGQPVELEFLTPGGTNDIRRQLSTIYQAIQDEHDGKLPPEDQIDTGIDMVWGGGDYEFNSKLKPLGIFHAMTLDPKWLAQVFPQPALAGVKLYDQEKDASGHLMPPKWIGVCLSSFGIIYNADLYRSMGLQPPKTWTDLADPRLAGSLSLADPTHSGSAGVTYMMVVQRSMADAETAFFALPENAGKPVAALKALPGYSLAIDAGWKKGMAQLVLIAANARFFEDSSTQPPNDVAAGDAAAGMAIDFYGRVTEQTVGPDRQKFVSPRGATAITPDPIAILYGTHGQRLDLANHFIEFLLSPEGQRIWILKPGEPSGPRTTALRRSPIRQSVYDNRDGWADDLNYFESADGFNQRGEWMATYDDLPSVWAAAWIDTRDQLRTTYSKILTIKDDAVRQTMLDKLSDLPISRGDVMAEIAESKRIAKDRSEDLNVWKARHQLNWSEKFMQHYRDLLDEAEKEQP